MNRHTPSDHISQAGLSGELVWPCGSPGQESGSYLAAELFSLPKGPPRPSACAWAGSHHGMGTALRLQQRCRACKPQSAPGASGAVHMQPRGPTYRTASTTSGAIQ